jgi:hypothetical protein
MKPNPDPRLFAGIGFVATFLVGLVAASLLATGPYPVPGTPAPDIVAYLAANPASVAVNVLAQVIAGFALVVFAVGLARSLPRPASGQILAAGTLAGGALALSGAVLATAFATAAEPALAATPAVVAALHHLTFLLGGPLHVVFLAMLVGTASIAGRLGGRLPGWLAVSGMVIAGIGLLSVLAIVVPALPMAAVSAPIPLGRFLAFGWIVLSVVQLRRGATRPDAAEVRAAAA